MFPFALRCAPSRYDPNRLLTVVFEPRVYNQQQGRAFDEAHRDPAFLILAERITLSQREGIVKYQYRSLEADRVLQEVPPVLFFVPLETHGRNPAFNIMLPAGIINVNTHVRTSLNLPAQVLPSACATPQAKHSADSSRRLLPQ